MPWGCTLGFLILMLLSPNGTSGQSVKAGRQKSAPLGNLSPEEVAARAKEAVVLVECRTAGNVTSFGSGFLVDRLGLVATNAHVAGACDSLTVGTHEFPSSRAATLVALDGDHDVAILLVPGLRAKPLSLAISEGIRPGQ